MRDPNREFTPDTKRKIWQEQWGRCALCGEKCKGHGATRRGGVHHITPISRGGSRDRRNGIGLCQPCHERADKFDLRRPLAKP
jgi:5-methylcytosine-specific restriction endonuclease McrA